MAKTCFTLVRSVVILLSLMSESFLAYENDLYDTHYHDHRLEQEIDRSVPAYVRKLGKSSEKILSRHKRIKKSVTPVGGHLERLSGLDVASSHKQGMPYLPRQVNKKRPLTLVKEDPYIRRNVRTSARKPNSNLNVVRAGKKDRPKKFKRSLSFNDFSRSDLEMDRRQSRRTQSKYYKNRSGRRIKMKGGHEFYNLDEAKNELDRRRKLIRKLEKKINYRNKGLSKYMKRPYYLDNTRFFHPTIESIKDQLLNQQSSSDDKNLKTSNYGRQKLSQESLGREDKIKKSNSAKKTSRN